MRLELQRLEDRLVPGQVLETALLWALGPLTALALVAPDSAASQGPARTVGGPWAARIPARAARLSDTLAFYLQAINDSPATGATVARSPMSGDAAPPAGEPAFTPSGHCWDAGTNNATVPDTAAPAQVGGSLNAPPQSAPARPSALPVGQPGTAAVALPTAAAAGARATVPSAAANPVATDAVPAGVAVDGSAAGGEATPMFHGRHVAAPNAGAARPFGAYGTAPFSPSQIRQAYGFNQLSNQGAGQTIYIVDAYNNPNIASDLRTFDAQWGLPDPNFTVHKMTGSVANDPNWGLEEALDVEWAHAIAPQANIVLVEAPSAYTSDLLKAVDWATNNGAHIVSMSWGAGDISSGPSLDSHFNHNGVSYVASAGDTGGLVNYPAASPYVLSVGGTSLRLNSSNGYVSESAWSNGGGGASVVESEPGYQKSYGIRLGGRGTPDVAYNADPNTGFYVYDSYYSGGGGWFAVGGTSAGAPQWAALIALADQSRSTPLSTNNLATRSEYSAAASAIYSSNYHDIITGSNGYAATTGYDLATGLGSPKANALVPWLIAHG